MEKHAYLILAHKLDYTFKILIKMLDDCNNDIYIHMDKKNKSFTEKEVKKLVSKSNIFFTKRTSVQWGAYSIVNAQLLLLKKATSNNNYFYYHLISGEDLPIKSQQYIHNFFEDNKGYEFIRFENEKFLHENRVKYIYIFQEKIGRKKNIFKVINKIFLLIQKKLNFSSSISRKIKFQKGTNWCSITDDLARYIISKEKWIKKTFKHVFCSDELVFHTIVYNSKFKEKLYNKNYDNDINAMMRLIDWKRGTPYVFRKKDFDEIKNSNMLFARKFDCNIDKKIIDDLYNLYKG